MKKIILTAVVTGTLLACTRKITATRDSVTDTDHSSVSSSVLPGRYIYQSKCGTCHGLKNITSYTASQWNEILHAMAPKAKLNEMEKQQLIAFIGDQVKE